MQHVKIPSATSNRALPWATVLLCSILVGAPLATGAAPLTDARLDNAALPSATIDDQAWSNENAPAGTLGWGMGGSTSLLVIGTLGDGTFQSQDNGHNWQHLEDFPITEPSSANGDGFAFDPTDPDVAYICGFGGVARTTDGGDTWEHILDNERCRVATVSLDGRVAVSERLENFDNRIIISDDQGETWSDVNAPVGSSALYGIAFGPTNDHLVVASIGTTWATQDGGETWSTDSQGVRDMTADADGTIWRAGFGLFQKSEDGGATWQDVDLPATAGSLGAHTEGGLFVTTGNGVYHKQDAGETWQALGFEDVTFGTVATVADPHEADAVFLAHEGLGAVRIGPVGDGSYAMEGRTNGLPAVDLLSLGSSADGSLLLAGGPLGLFASRDDGQSWSHTGAGYGFNGIHATTANHDGSTVYAGGQTMFFWPFLIYSQDGGTTWDHADVNIGGDGNVLSIVSHPEEPQTAYAAVWGELTDSQVLRTTNRGADWEPILVSPLNIWDATWNTATGQLLIATDNGVLAYNEELGWLPTSITGTPVRAVDADGGHAYAGIIGSTIWRTPGPLDIFAPWSVEGGAPNALAAHPQDGSVYSITQNNQLQVCHNTGVLGTCSEDSPPSGDFRDTFVRTDGQAVFVASHGSGLWTAHLG